MKILSYHTTESNLASFGNFGALCQAEKAIETTHIFPNQALPKIFSFVIAKMKLSSVTENSPPFPAFMDAGFHFQQQLVFCMGASQIFTQCPSIPHGVSL